VSAISATRWLKASGVLRPNSAALASPSSIEVGRRATTASLVLRRSAQGPWGGPVVAKATDAWRRQVEREDLRGTVQELGRAGVEWLFPRARARAGTPGTPPAPTR